MAEGLEGQKLLIVDDDKVWLNQLSRAMSRRGLRVYEAQSVDEALNILEKVCKNVLKTIWKTFLKNLETFWKNVFGNTLLLSIFINISDRDVEPIFGAQNHEKR